MTEPLDPGLADWERELLEAGRVDPARITETPIANTAFAAGWAAAVEALRDTGRVDDWVLSNVRHAVVTRFDLADYLEAVAPGRPGAPDGATP